MKKLNVNKLQEMDDDFRMEVINTILRYVKEFTGVVADPDSLQTIGSLFASNPNGLRVLYMALRITELPIGDFANKDIGAAAQYLTDNRDGEMSKQQVLALMALQIQKNLKGRLNL